MTITAQTVYALLGNESLWDVAARCHELLREAEIPHAIHGGVAVCLHGYQRDTVDLDLLVRREDVAKIRFELERAGFTWSLDRAAYVTSSGIAVKHLLSTDRAGKGSEVRLPDPTDENAITELEGLPVLTLAKLIESKLACGQANLRRTHKDFADVVELIAKHDLSRSFARYLHKSLRATFRDLVLRARET